MRRIKRLVQCFLCTSSLFLLVACHGGSTVKTYVNKNNPTEKLTLKPGVSPERSLYNVFHDDLKMDSGTYTLETAAGTSSGVYDYAVRDKGRKSYIFQPKDGVSWGVELNADDSFKDSNGEWELQKA